MPFGDIRVIRGYRLRESTSLSDEQYCRTSATSALAGYYYIGEQNREHVLVECIDNGFEGTVQMISS